MSRSYTLKRRAEQQAQTRQRIVEAAVDLHTRVGPALTTVSMIAEQAGVQRQTFYAHFPDERSLAMACSGLALERDPLPDPGGWPEGAERLATGLGELYGWYERNAELTGCVLRDAEHHALTREIAELRFGPALGALRQALGGGLTADQQALLEVAMSFHTWRTLRGAGVDGAQAVRLMSQAVRSAAEPPRELAAAPGKVQSAPSLASITSAGG